MVQTSKSYQLGETQPNQTSLIIDFQPNKTIRTKKAEKTTLSKRASNKSEDDDQGEQTEHDQAQQWWNQSPPSALRPAQ
jgi:hypothetical protein